MIPIGVTFNKWDEFNLDGAFHLWFDAGADDLDWFCICEISLQRMGNRESLVDHFLYNVCSL